MAEGSGVGRDWSVGNAVKLVSRRDSSPNFVGKRCDESWVESREIFIMFDRCRASSNRIRKDAEGIRYIDRGEKLGQGNLVKRVCKIFQRIE